MTSEISPRFRNMVFPMLSVYERMLCSYCGHSILRFYKHGFFWLYKHGFFRLFGLYHKRPIDEASFDYFGLDNFRISNKISGCVLRRVMEIKKWFPVLRFCQLVWTIHFFCESGYCVSWSEHFALKLE